MLRSDDERCLDTCVITACRPRDVPDVSKADNQSGTSELAHAAVH